QSTPEPAGNGSFSVTAVALPRPELDTMIVNPIWLPAETVAASAVLETCSDGHWTVTEAVEVSPPSLPEETVAVLDPRAQSSLVVAEVTWIGPMLLLGANEAKVQFK